MTDPIETRRRFYAEELRFTTRGEFSAQFLCAAAFYEFSGARDPDVGSRLEQALTRDRGTGVKSLSRDSHPEEETCRLHGDGWCLSRRQMTGDPKV